MIKLSDKEFEQIAGLIHTRYGINLSQKRTLIESRMNSVLTQKGIDSFTEYIAKMQHDQSLAVEMVNKLTTNHTYFMRESAHYDFLRDVFLPEMEKTRVSNKEIRIWSAGSSSGEEAFTAVMQILDYFGKNAARWDFRILGSDISERVMGKAAETAYNLEDLKNLSTGWINTFFNKTPDGLYTLTKAVTDQVIFRKMNLMEPFSFKKPMDLIFCRNVMIYFDQPTRNNLIRKYYDVLAPGGYLLIGHSETLRQDAVPFRYVRSSVYQKPF